MKSLGKRPEGARLERIKASPRWAGDRFRTVHPILPGLRDPNAQMPSLGDFLCGGERRVHATLWSSLVVRSQSHAVFFSGDTGLTTEYGDIRERLGPFDLALVEVGAFHPAWGDIHLGPENALKASGLLGSSALLPIHWGTFSLALHAWDQPAETLLELAPQYDARLVMPRLGEPVEPAHVKRAEAWWRAVDSIAVAAPDAPVPTSLPKAMQWPID